MKSRSQKTILFTVLYLLLIFFAVEVFCRVILASDAFFYKLHGPVQGLDDASQRIQWVKAYQRQNLVVHNFNNYSPSRGWGVVPGLKQLPVFDGKTMNTNSRGLRGAKEYSYERVPGKSRVVLLGDSFTFGDEVSDHETYVHHLERMYPNTEFINLGVSGYGHDQMLLYWKEEGVRYKPDLVILGFLYYDMERNLRKFRFYSKPKFVSRGGRLKLVNSPVPEPERLAAEEIFKLKTFDLIHMLWQRIGWNTGINVKKMKSLSGQIMDEIVESVRASGAVPVFAYFSTEDDFIQYFSSPTEREEFFFDYCESSKVDCVSVRPAFIERLKAGETLDTYGHWDPRGHEIAAQTISRFLDEKGFSKKLEVQRFQTPDAGSLKEERPHA